MKRRDAIKTVASGLGLWLAPGAAAYFGAERAKQRAVDERVGVKEEVSVVEWKLPTLPKDYYVREFERIWNELRARGESQ